MPTLQWLEDIRGTWFYDFDTCNEIYEPTCDMLGVYENEFFSPPPSANFQMQPNLQMGNSKIEFQNMIVLNLIQYPKFPNQN